MPQLPYFISIAVHTSFGDFEIYYRRNDTGSYIIGSNSHIFIEVLGVDNVTLTISENPTTFVAVGALLKSSPDQQRLLGELSTAILRNRTTTNGELSS